MNDPLASRGSSPYGKCFLELKTHVTDELDQLARADAARRGQTVSEWLRDLIARECLGSVEVRRRLLEHHGLKQGE